MASKIASRVDEVVSMWRGDEYDNFKDVIEDCQSLLSELPADAARERALVESVLTDATTQAQEMVDESPEMADYMAGLIDPAWLSAEYKAEQADTQPTVEVKPTAEAKPKPKPKPKPKAKPKAKRSPTKKRRPAKKKRATKKKARSSRRRRKGAKKKKKKR